MPSHSHRARSCLVTLALLFSLPVTPTTVAAAVTAGAVLDGGDGDLERVAVAPFVITGDVPEYLRDAMVERVVEGLARGAFEAVPPAAFVAAAPAAATCADLECLAEAAEAAGVVSVVRVTLTRDEPDIRLTIELIDSDGSVRATVQRTCEICGEDELGELLSDAVASLRPRLDEDVERPARIVVTGSPEGASVFIDGARVGALPYEGELPPGTHSLRVEHEGYAAQESEWTAASSVQDHMKFNLNAIERATVRTIRPLWGWLGLGLGLGAVAGGSALLAIDDRPYAPSCEGDLTDANGRCPQRYNTLAGGVALVSVGVAAAAAGVGLLIVSYRSRRREANLTIRPGGISLVGRF